jgi:dTDP-4-dehydrorhamnose reductase
VKVAVTGATGRLGQAVVEAIKARPAWLAIPWTRETFDLDEPSGAAAGIARDRPDAVIHCAAWTDVDGCAREPDLAARRNGLAVGELAGACGRSGTDLVAVSTNEVFDGRRTDGRAYAPGDPTAPPNPYGRSKRLGEELAIAAMAGSAGRLLIVRTAWLFGPPGTDFPTKILRAAQRAVAAGEPLKLVADEVGSPSYAADVAAGIADLLADRASAGIQHVVNTGQASRAEWARALLDLAGVRVSTEDVSADLWPRASTPPRWGVLEPTRLPTIGRLRPWQAAVAEDAADRFGASQEVARP